MLAGELLHQRLNFPLHRRFAKRHENIRIPQIPFVFGDLVFEDDVIAEGVSGEFRHHAMVLVHVVPPVGEDEIGID
jgi:hypothetical protein